MAYQSRRFCAAMVSILGMAGCNWDATSQDSQIIDIANTSPVTQAPIPVSTLPEAAVPALGVSPFTHTDQAIWDGRETRGGVWVAHQQAANVAPHGMIMAVDSGRSVYGRAYSRDHMVRPRDWGAAGPAFIVSSDAARALGMVAGQPVRLRFVEGAESEPEVADVMPDKPFIQAGVFSTRTRAEQAADALRANDVPVRIIKIDASPDYYRLLIGPAESHGQRAEFLRKSHELGFDDAYLTTTQRP